MEIRKLNSLRALAALIVLVTHFSDATGWLDGMLGGRAGQYGVMLFFMLSGFLMGHLYLTQPVSNKNTKRYLVARCARILPLYFLVVFASYLSETNGNGLLFAIGDGQALLAHLLFLDGESVLWTIAPEVHFYLLFIAIWYLSNWRPGYVYVLVASSLIVLFFLNFPRPTGEIFGLHYDFHIFRSLPYFLIGLILGKHYQTATIPDYLKRHSFVFALLLIPLLYPELSPVKSDSVWRMWLNYEVLIVFTAVFFCLVFLVPDNNKLLANSIGDFLGKISYSLYLLHMPILAQINTLGIGIEIKLLVFVALSVACAYASYILIERPSAKMLRRYFSAKSAYLEDNKWLTARR